MSQPQMSQPQTAAPAAAPTAATTATAPTAACVRLFSAYADTLCHDTTLEQSAGRAGVSGCFVRDVVTADCVGRGFWFLP